MINKILKEFDEKFGYCFKKGVEVDKITQENIENFLRQKLEDVEMKQRDFAQDYADMAYKQGKEDLKKEILEKLPSEQTGKCLEPESYEKSGWKERDSGFNSCLKQIKQLITKIK
jgi:hypothetical protein